MNIFFLDLDAVKAALMYCDKHVVKIILEVTQMLWNAWHVTGGGEWESVQPVKVYKKTHVNHPMSIWVRSHPNNYMWTVIHGIALCDEYSRRYSCKCNTRKYNCDKCPKKTHACKEILEWLYHEIPMCDETKTSDNSFYAETKPTGCTNVPVCITDLDFLSDDLVKAYRSYYIFEKIPKGIAKWQYGTPAWTNKK
jgi:hypothetical protein